MRLCLLKRTISSSTKEAKSWEKVKNRYAMGTCVGTCVGYLWCEYKQNKLNALAFV